MAKDKMSGHEDLITCSVQFKKIFVWYLEMIMKLSYKSKNRTWLMLCIQLHRDSVRD
jgi:predicted ATP-binding protein involved in virulence